MTYRFIVLNVLIQLAAHVRAQTESSVADLVARALVASPAVAAHKLSLQEAEATARSLASAKAIELEVSPGVGFTNSNFVVGQTFDTSGSRGARARRARAEAKAVAAGLRRTQIAVASEVLEAYAQYLAAAQAEQGAAASLNIARATTAAIAQRVEVGEAPALQLTRSEIELTRAEQAVHLAAGDRAAKASRVNSLLGLPLESEVPIVPWGAFDTDVDPVSVIARSPDHQEALANIEAAGAAEAEVRSQRLPSVYAGVAADVWSLDRRPFQRENLGLQLRISMPLFDWGETRHAARAANAAIRAKEAQLRESERLTLLDLAAAVRLLEAARKAAAGYEVGLLPKAERMVEAMQAGLKAGLSNFLDVLEAQRTLSLLRREQADALLNVHLAEVRLYAAAAHVPGLENKK